MNTIYSLWMILEELLHVRSYQICFLIRYNLWYDSLKFPFKYTAFKIN